MTWFEFLLTTVPSLNAQDKSGNTPLHLALLQRNSNLISFILQYKPNCALKNKRGQTALDLSLAWENVEIIRAINEILNYDQKNPLFSVAQLDYVWLLENVFENEKALEEWLDRQSKLQKASANMWTLLHAAAESGLTKFIKHLVEQGADLAAESFNGYTPLYFAILNNHQATVKLLLDLGADLNIAKGRFGNTPLHVAVKEKNLEMVKILVKRGADVNAVNKDGENVLVIALKNADLETYIWFFENTEIVVSDREAIQRQYSCYKALQQNNFQVLAELLEHEYFHDDQELIELTKAAIVGNVDKDTIIVLIQRLNKNKVETYKLANFDHLCKLAVENNYNIFINILLEQAPSLFSVDYYDTKFGLLRRAIESGNNYITQLFAPLYTNHIDFSGETALSTAVKAENVYAVQLLISLKARSDYETPFALDDGEKFLTNYDLRILQLLLIY